MAEDEIIFVPWYVDDSNNPSCPSFWEDEYDCDRENCPFSHDDVKFSTTVPLSGSLNENPLKVFTDIKNYLNTYPSKDPVQDLRIQNPEDERDFERINLLMMEMNHFEKGPELFDSYIICPFLNDTGNCIIRDLCEYAHSADDQKIKDFERVQEWYPGSMNCQCCKGFIYGCEAQDCKKQGKCLICVN